VVVLAGRTSESYVRPALFCPAVNFRD